MVFDFLQPVSDEFLEFVEGLSSQTLGKKAVFNTVDDFPILDDVHVAIIAVNEFRGGNVLNEDDRFDNFRKQFYSLYPGNWNVSIVDLGNIQSGETIEDTYFLVASICEDLIRKHILPVIIGGSQI